MFYFAADGADGGTNIPFNTHSHFFVTRGNASPGDAGVGQEVASGSQNNLSPTLGFNFWPPPPLHGEMWGTGQMPMTYTPNAWHCLQFALDGASGTTPANRSRMWLDGNLIIDLPASMGWIFPTWTQFDFGFETLQPETNPTDVSLDSFALDGQMIPCP
jgi:hypothetical protein